MSQQVQAHAAAHEGHRTNYVLIWGVLLGLLIVSVTGPMLEIRVLTLITAFGIALVKAYLVAKHFMHLNIERRYIVYLLITGIACILLFFAGTAPDVMNHEGQQWTNLKAMEVTGERPGGGGAAAEAGDFDAKTKFDQICAGCHGAAGDGAGAAAAALNPKPANFTDPTFWEARDKASIAKAIKEGGPSVGKSPLMAPFGGQFSDAEIDLLADYVIAFGPGAAQ